MAEKINEHCAEFSSICVYTWRINEWMHEIILLNYMFAATMRCGEWGENVKIDIVFVPLTHKHLNENRTWTFCCNRISQQNSVYSVDVKMQACARVNGWLPTGNVRNWREMEFSLFFVLSFIQFAKSSRIWAENSYTHTRAYATFQANTILHSARVNQTSARTHNRHKSTEWGASEQTRERREMNQKRNTHRQTDWDAEPSDIIQKRAEEKNYTRNIYDE